MRENLIGQSSKRLTNKPLEERPKGMWGINSSNHDVKECNDRASMHVHGQSHGGASPGLIADVAADPELLRQVLEALDTQVSAELPLEYHAVYLAQRALHVSKRRDPAHEAPAPPSSKSAYATDSVYAPYRQRGLSYEAYRDKVWWPEFEHFAFTVVMNKQSHEHMKSCTKTDRGKVGCRFCAVWPHAIERTRCLELRVIPTDGPPPDKGHEFRCPICYADGALGQRTDLSDDQRQLALKAEDTRRDIFFTAHDVSRADGGNQVDARLLSVELRRRLMPIKEDEHEHGALFDRQQMRELINSIGVGLDTDADSLAPSDSETQSEADSEAAEMELVDEFAVLVERATETRLPYPFVDPRFAFTVDLSEARSTLRRLMAKGQRLHKLLAHPELASLRERMDALTVDPLKPAACAADSMQAGHAQHEQDRATLLFRVLEDLTWPEPKKPQPRDALGHLIKQATRERRPWRYFEQHRELADDNTDLWAEARATLRGLMAEGQPLQRLLARDEFAALRARIEMLAAEPRPETAGDGLEPEDELTDDEMDVDESHCHCCSGATHCSKVAKPARPAPPSDGADVAELEVRREKRDARCRAELFNLLNLWSWADPNDPKHDCVMPCRNGLIADFTTVLSGCTKGNAVPYTLGAGAGSKAGAMYQIKCVTPPLASLPRGSHFRALFL